MDEQVQEPRTDETFQSLLNQLDVGDADLIDPKAGKHEATLIGVEVTQNNDGRPAIVAILGGMTDTNGKEFELKHRINVALRSDDLETDRGRSFVFGFTSQLKRLGAVPPSFAKPVYAETVDEAEKLVGLIITPRIGAVYQGQVKIDDSGFPKWTFFAEKKKKVANGADVQL